MARRRATRRSGIRTTSHFKGVLNTVSRKAQAECNAAAEEAKLELQNELDVGGKRIQTDKGAARASIYTIRKGQGGNFNYQDYARALSQMKAIDAKEDHELDVYINPKPKRISSATVTTISKVLWWWEYGHHNLFTGQFEYAPRFEPLAQRTGATFAYRFAQLLSKNFRQGS